MGFLDYDVEIRKIICSADAIESSHAHYRRRASQRTLRDRTSCAHVPLHLLAGPTGRGQARWVARCVYDHRDYVRKAVPRTSRKEVRRHKAYGHTTNHGIG